MSNLRVSTGHLRRWRKHEAEAGILGLIQFRERARILVDLTKLLQTNMGDIRYTCVYCCPGPGLCGAWPELCVRVPCVYCTFLCKTQFVKWILTAQKPGPDIAANLVENAGIIHNVTTHGTMTRLVTPCHTRAQLSRSHHSL